MDKNLEPEFIPLRPRRKLSFLSSFSKDKDEEDKIIEEATTTNYEKVIKILLNVKTYFEEKQIEKEMATDISWVLGKIQSHTLYTYDVTEPSSFSEKFERFSMENGEVKSFIEYLNDFSEVKEVQRRNRDTKISKTQKLNIQEKKKLMSKFSKRNKSVTNFDFDNEKLLILKEFNFVDNEEDEVDLKVIQDKDFNIFEFSNQVQKENLLPIIGRYSYTATNLLDFLNVSKLDTFLECVRDGYKNVPYHSSSHAADVCQTTLIILLHSNIIEVLQLTPYDVISLITAALVHDIGHPGYNNTFQINNFTDYAITYNDKSVLENFHIAESFRILRREDSNIFSKFDSVQYRNVRKRMIELVLATDMMYHAKIVGLIKNKVLSNGISNGKNNTLLINSESDRLFDDQQEVINFILHTCDLGHNSKSFDVSYKWTYMLMNEFWAQGDSEREKGMPISFLCDRNTADVPKNQIVFIKSIIIPNFEVLIEIFPELKHFKENIDNNVQSWMKLYEEDQAKYE